MSGFRATSGNVLMSREFKSIELWRCVIAECLATFFYVFLPCTATLNWDAAVFRVGVSTADVIQVSLAFGLAGCAMTQCFGHVSGGHFNPAITFASIVTCKVTPLRGVLYAIAQCGGGIAGAALLYGLAPEKVRGHLGVTTLNPVLTPSQGFGVEFVLSFVLVFTFFATVDPKRRQQGSEAVPIGLTLVMVNLAGSRLTGSSCNPARSLGPAFVTNSWQQHWIYWAGPMGGGLIAGLLYQYIFDPSRMKLGLNSSSINNNNISSSTITKLKRGSSNNSVTRKDSTVYTFSNGSIPTMHRAPSVTTSSGQENTAYQPGLARHGGHSLRHSHRSLSRERGHHHRKPSTDENRSESDYSRRKALGINIATIPDA